MKKNDLAFQWKNFFEFQMDIDKHTHTQIYTYDITSTYEHHTITDHRQQN